MPPRADDDEVDAVRLGLLREYLPGLAAVDDAPDEADAVGLGHVFGAAHEELCVRLLVVHARREREDRRHLDHGNREDRGAVLGREARRVRKLRRRRIRG